MNVIKNVPLHFWKTKVVISLKKVKSATHNEESVSDWQVCSWGLTQNDMKHSHLLDCISCTN
jgi:hypothetical protein